MKSLIDTAREYLSGPLEEDITLNEGAFYRLPGHVIGNELYVVTDLLKSFYSTQTNGNDFNMKNFAHIISMLQKIKAEAKQFGDKEDVPVSYRYKDK